MDCVLLTLMSVLVVVFLHKEVMLVLLAAAISLVTQLREVEEFMHGPIAFDSLHFVCCLCLQ